MSHESPIPDAIPFRTLGALSGATKVALAVLIAIGALGVFLAAGHEAARMWQALLFNWLFWSSVAMGMVMFAVALHLTNADWAWSIRRFALGGGAFLPISFVLLIPILIGGHHDFFHHWLGVEGDPVIEAKAAWLNWPGLAWRDFFLVGTLYTLALFFMYWSLRPDVYGAKGEHRGLYERLTSNFGEVRDEAARSHRNLLRLGVVMGIAYAVIWGIVAIDLAMSMAPHWFSTMFPVAFFWTGFHGGVAATVIAVVLLRSRMGLDNFITVRQFHDLGKLVFAFSVFWMYLNWSQYIVIWYALLPWEQEFFVKRFGELYGPVSGAVVILVFVLPFVGLLTRQPKKVPPVLAFFATLILVGHWLERFLLIAPSMWEGEGLPLGIPEIAVGLGFLGLFAASYLWYLRRAPILPSPAALAARGSSVVAVPVGAAEA